MHLEWGRKAERGGETHGLTAQKANRNAVLIQLMALSLTLKNCEEVLETAVKDSHCEDR